MFNLRLLSGTHARERGFDLPLSATRTAGAVSLLIGAKTQFFPLGGTRTERRDIIRTKSGKYYYVYSDLKAHAKSYGVGLMPKAAVALLGKDPEAITAVVLGGAREPHPLVLNAKPHKKRGPKKGFPKLTPVDSLNLGAQSATLLERSIAKRVMQELLPQIMPRLMKEMLPELIQHLTPRIVREIQDSMGLRKGAAG